MRWGFAVVALGCIGYAIWTTDRSGLSDVRIDWPWLLAAAAALPGMYVCIALSERLLLRTFTGRRLSWPELIAAAWVPLFGKYIPGKVAAAGAAVVLLKRLGVPASTALGVFVLLDAMPVLTGTLLGAVLLLDDSVRERFAAAPLVFAGVFVGGLVCLSPPVFRRVTTLALRLMRRPPLPIVPRWVDYVGPLTCSLGQWACNGFAVWFVMRSLDPAVTLASLPYVVCATALTMCVSYFGAFVTPSGLGVREGTLIALLSPMIGLPNATAAAVLMRLNHTVTEAYLCGIGLLALRAGGTRSGEEAKGREGPEAA